MNSACSSNLLGNMSRVKGKWITPGPGRQRHPSGTKLERLYLRRLKRDMGCLEEKNNTTSRCCKTCPAGVINDPTPKCRLTGKCSDERCDACRVALGKFLNSSCVCETCRDESYLAYSNQMRKCLPCEKCSVHDYQVVVKDCTPEQNRECGCARGYYEDRDHPTDNINFSCIKCDDCGALNRQTWENCSKNNNTVCGDCLPNLIEQGDACQPMTPSNMTEESIPVPEPRKSGFKPEYLLSGLSFLFLLVGSVIYCMWRRITRKSSSVGVDTLVNSKCIDMLLAAAGAASSPKYKSEEAPEFPSSVSPSQVQCGALHADPSSHQSLLQGRKLYAVIDTVPVRRWKEFVRGLGLRDGEIESVEVEHRQLREQQYEMLKRWQRQQGATVEAIFAVLEDMQLGGCAQELREQLQPSLLPSHL